MRTHVRKCANVCKLISGIGRRLEDILGTRAVVGFFLVVANGFST